MDYGRANLAFSATLLHSAVRHGLRHVVICPGSRSTPLALAAACHPALTTHVLIDERSAAFFALGMARELGEPVALISTSGTAAANFAPAVIEAYLSRIPLLIVTADRPAELRDWGASQTIDQVDLYGSHTRWSRDLPPPVGDAVETRFAQAVAARGMALASGPPAGPVHLNVQFREPLIPADSDPLELLRERYSDADLTPLPKRQSFPPPPRDIERLVNRILAKPRGIIVCGPHTGSDPGYVAAALSEASGYPCLADPLSTVRFSWPGSPGLIDAYDMFLRDANLSDRLAPDVVIRVGGMPTSKPLTQFLARQSAEVIAIDPGNLRDAGHTVTWHLAADEAVTLSAASEALAGVEVSSTGWRECWETVNSQTRKALEAQVSPSTAITEPTVAASLLQAMPPGSTLVVGNSMPVRDIDTFAGGGNRDVRVTGTRGASGIDGVTSTAIGAASVASGPVALLVGDLSFLHDLGGLQAAHYARRPLVILVVNNNGGGIFSFLPQHAQIESSTFELLFGTPSSIDVQRAAELFECAYIRPSSIQELRDAINMGLATAGVTIIEARTDRAENLALHRRIALGVLAEIADMREA